MPIIESVVFNASSPAMLDAEKRALPIVLEQPGLRNILRGTTIEGDRLIWLLGELHRQACEALADRSCRMGDTG